MGQGYLSSWPDIEATDPVLSSGSVFWTDCIPHRGRHINLPYFFAVLSETASLVQQAVFVLLPPPLRLAAANDSRPTWVPRSSLR